MSLIYAHVYEVDRQYGGPEEGGWFYETGEPIAHPLNRTFRNKAAALDWCRKSNAALLEQNREEGRRHPSSVLSRGDWLEMDVSTAPPAPYPTTRPHYE